MKIPNIASLAPKQQLNKQKSPINSNSLAFIGLNSIGFVNNFKNNSNNNADVFQKQKLTQAQKTAAILGKIGRFDFPIAKEDTEAFRDIINNDIICEGILKDENVLQKILQLLTPDTCFKVDGKKLSALLKDENIAKIFLKNQEGQLVVWKVLDVSFDDVESIENFINSKAFKKALELSDDIYDIHALVNCNKIEPTRKIFEKLMADNKIVGLIKNKTYEIYPIAASLVNKAAYIWNTYGSLNKFISEKNVKRVLKDKNIIKLSKSSSIEIHDVISEIETTKSWFYGQPAISSILFPLKNKKTFDAVKNCKLTVPSIRLFHKLTPKQKEELFSLEKSVAGKAISSSIFLLQNEGGYCVTLKKEQENNGVKVEFLAKIMPDGKINYYRSEGEMTKEEDKKEETIKTSWAINKNSSLAIKELAKNEDEKETLEELEVLYTDEKEPYAFLTTRKTGTNFEIKRHLFSEYPENMDILKMFKMGVMYGGKIISGSVKEKNGRTFEDEFFYHDLLINRMFKEKKNEKGEVEGNVYSYQIADVNGRIKFLLNRSLKIDSSTNSTTTTLNGKKFKAEFDDSSKTIKITDDNSKTTEINIKEKLKAFSDKADNPLNRVLNRSASINSNQQEDIENMWNFIKVQPADLLLNLNDNVKIITPAPNREIASYNSATKRLIADSKTRTIAHEIGHGINDKNKVSKNEELIKIYNKEADAFEEDFPKEKYKIIEYFLHNGGGRASVGLEELIAETYALFTTYCTNDYLQREGNLAKRALYLVQYFPETIAKIADILGYNSIE